MDTNNANRRCRCKTLAATTLAAAALGSSVTATATTNEDPATAGWERCVAVSKDALFARDVHDAFLC